MTAAGETACAVCGGPGDESTTALCGECDRRFHLNQRNDVQGKDCGEVWIDEQYLSLRFACFTCLGLATAAGEPPVSAEPPVGEGH